MMERKKKAEAERDVRLALFTGEARSTESFAKFYETVTREGHWEQDWVGVYVGLVNLYADIRRAAALSGVHPVVFLSAAMRWLVSEIMIVKAPDEWEDTLLAVASQMAEFMRTAAKNSRSELLAKAGNKTVH